ncbi:MULTISPECIES: ECF transporter S component [unclassified Oceanispirochaeta]|uniref:ECF transporter S component n=1 Tax=unclassified Oceanispirochaeta TaxID=2635722 RepID=UPI000E08F833|nr:MULTISPECIES: ECF transporter S component [unclassified Oceanispirochaeta]MBF9017953.1 ECF transporter S component [Oceanispirochaeta sp. M2]NPD74464.1 alpha-ribazole transporter [Oceanispirochaeta sp. M1]RDG29673.1 alpha-ribazole transporter [Oceanispirochaeta sp. M1]
MSETVKVDDVTEETEVKRGFWSVKRVSYVAIFIALSAVGAMIKIPSPIGSVGLDSVPGFFCALAFGGIEGAIVISIGHILSAAFVGFPLTLPIHLAIAITMAVWAFLYRLLSKLNIILAIVVTVLLNGFVSGLLLLLLGGWGLYIGTVPFLLVASAVNVILSAIAFKAVKSSKLL